GGRLRLDRPARRRARSRESPCDAPGGLPAARSLSLAQRPSRHGAESATARAREPRPRDRAHVGVAGRWRSHLVHGWASARLQSHRSQWRATRCHAAATRATVGWQARARGALKAWQIPTAGVLQIHAGRVFVLKPVLRVAIWSYVLARIPFLWKR